VADRRVAEGRPT